MEQPSSSAGIASFDGLNDRQTRPNGRALQIFKSIKDPKAKPIESEYAHDPTSGNLNTKSNNSGVS